MHYALSFHPSLVPVKEQKAFMQERNPVNAFSPHSCREVLLLPCSKTLNDSHGKWGSCPNIQHSHVRPTARLRFTTFAEFLYLMTLRKGSTICIICNILLRMQNGKWSENASGVGTLCNTWTAFLKCICIGVMGIQMGLKFSTGHTHWEWLRKAQSGTSAAYRFPSTTSMRSSAVESLRRVTSALWILYSARILLTVSASSSVCAH